MCRYTSLIDGNQGDVSVPRSDQSQRFPIITVGAPSAPASIATTLRGRDDEIDAVVNAAISSKSFIRSTQSQRWIVIPKRRSAARRSCSQSSYWRLIH